MTLTSITGAAGASIEVREPGSSGFAKLGQTDFLKMLTVQMQQQDPFDPVDQKEMLAQMAQFSMLAGITEINERLKTLGGTTPSEA